MKVADSQAPFLATLSIRLSTIDDPVDATTIASAMLRDALGIGPGTVEATTDGEDDIVLAEEVHLADFGPAVASAFRRGETMVVTAAAAVLSQTLRRLRAERALRDSEANFRLLAETMPIQAWISDVDGRVLWVNEQAAAYTGESRDELRREDWERIVHPEDQAPVMAAWEAALTTGAPYVVEYRLRRHDGSFRWHIARALPFRDGTGAVVRWIGANTDIDDQRRALAELAHLNATLEARVEARTRELRDAEDALRQAQKMDAIGQLTGGIAHDFNNLLTGIIGSLELIGRRIASSRTEGLERFMEAAVSSANSAAALTQRLLAFARRQSLDNKPVPVAFLVHGMQDLLRRTLGDQVRLEIAAAADDWHAMTDPNALESAILNLAINGRDAMPDGGRLAINTQYLTVPETGLFGLEPGDYVAISVADSGVGMDPAVMERAFEPFFTTKPTGQGTGLGLSMVFGFARQSGGLAQIKSQPGEGTTVTIFLPRAASVAEQSRPPVAVAPAGLGETVLVVEDVAAVRQFMAEILRDLDYRIIEAGEGAEALPIIDSHVPVDLLVTDVGLPGMNGRQLAEYARGKRPGLKVLFVSGYAENVASRSSLLADGTDMISKPFDADTLALKVNEMLRPTPPATTQRPPP